MSTLSEFFLSSDATPRDLVIIQSYMDGVFRLIILIYALSLSALTFTHGYPLITIILSILLIMSISYAYFTLATVGNILLKIEGYNVFNLIFYYVSTTLLLLLFITIMFSIIKPFNKSKRNEKRRTI